MSETTPQMITDIQHEKVDGCVTPATLLFVDDEVNILSSLYCYPCENILDEYIILLIYSLIHSTNKDLLIYVSSKRR